MANLNGFNANDVEPNTAFEPIPAGKYLAAIAASETKQTRNGDGSYLELTLSILQGDYQGRMLWARLNLDNPNATAVKIARGDLSAICRAVNVMQPKDSTDRHNLPLVLIYLRILGPILLRTSTQTSTLGCIRVSRWNKHRVPLDI
ncbi:MAG: DUF669 domain-containing protein [Phycisphaeraceae bacterium JB051]